METFLFKLLDFFKCSELQLLVACSLTSFGNVTCTFILLYLKCDWISKQALFMSNGWYFVLFFSKTPSSFEMQKSRNWALTANPTFVFTICKYSYSSSLHLIPVICSWKFKPICYLTKVNLHSISWPSICMLTSSLVAVETVTPLWLEAGG